MHGDFDITEPGQEVVISGPHRGDIRCRLLRIEREGSVFGNVIADEVRVAGRFDGTCYAKTFLASETARIHGAINAAVHGIKPGARVRVHLGPEFPEAFGGALSPAIEADLVRDIEASLVSGGLDAAESASAPEARTPERAAVPAAPATGHTSPPARRQLPSLL